MIFVLKLLTAICYRPELLVVTLHATCSVLMKPDGFNINIIIRLRFTIFEPACVQFEVLEVNDTTVTASIPTNDSRDVYNACNVVICDRSRRPAACFSFGAIQHALQSEAAGRAF